MEFITCSSYDKGPLGTYAFFQDLEKSGLQVRRLMLSPYSELKEEQDPGKTLIILSPRFIPSTWEWDRIISWTAAGNRLITSGFFGPQYGWFQKKDYEIDVTLEPVGPVKVVLPVDSAFPYPGRLAPRSRMDFFPFLNRVFKSSDTVNLRYFESFSPNMLPLLVQGNKTIAVKRALGRGEWIMFTAINPFSNTMLEDSTWYRFATRLIGGDPKYRLNKVYFDEFHNGYRATRSLWELLRYYRFTDGIILISLLVLVFLFFLGIRILPPPPVYQRPEKDIIPGMQAMSRLLFRYKAWNDLLKRELHCIGSELAGVKDGDRIDPGILVENYLKKNRLPEYVGSHEELVASLHDIERDAERDKKEILKNFNTLVFMRKEMKK
jgi:hypothetical protein